MKRAQHIFSIVSLVVLYCFTISFTTPTKYVESASQETTEKTVVTTISQDLHQITATNSLLAIGFNQVVHQDQKVDLEPFRFTEANKALHAQFCSHYKQYVLCWKNWLIQTGKKNLLFPFHTFW